MNARMLERLLWSIAAATLFGGVVIWRATPLASAALARPALRPAPRWMDDQDAEGLARAGAALSEADPFRLDRQPAAVRYRPELEAPAGAAPPPAPPKPALVLRGIVGGPPWDAMLDGVPGRPGAVLVHRGDTLGGLTVSAISRDTVTIH
jgi:hypothetical protein